jgi:multisubunit Na+/H+ antiporter MnhC subunit
MDNEKYYDVDIQRKIREQAKTLLLWKRMMDWTFVATWIFLPCILIFVPFGWNLVLFGAYLIPNIAVVYILDRRITSPAFVGSASYLRLKKEWLKARVRFELKDGRSGVGVVDEIRSDGVNAMLLVASEIEGEQLVFPSEVSRVEKVFIRYVLPFCFILMAVVVAIALVAIRGAMTR